MREEFYTCLKAKRVPKTDSDALSRSTLKSTFGLPPPPQRERKREGDQSGNRASTSLSWTVHQFQTHCSLALFRTITFERCLCTVDLSTLLLPSPFALLVAIHQRLPSCPHFSLICPPSCLALRNAWHGWRLQWVIHCILASSPCPSPSRCLCSFWGSMFGFLSLFACARGRQLCCSLLGGQVGSGCAW